MKDFRGARAWGAADEAGHYCMEKMARIAGTGSRASGPLEGRGAHAVVFGRMQRVFVGHVGADYFEGNTGGASVQREEATQGGPVSEKRSSQAAMSNRSSCGGQAARRSAHDKHRRVVEARNQSTANSRNKVMSALSERQQETKRMEVGQSTSKHHGGRALHAGSPSLHLNAPRQSHQAATA